MPSADDEIRKLAEATLEHHKEATPGPWFIVYSAVHSEPLVTRYGRIEATIPEDAPEAAYEVLPDTSVACVPVAAGDTPTIQGGKDGAFIAHARTAAPKLARAVLELLRYRQAVTEVLDETETRLIRLRAMHTARGFHGHQVLHDIRSAIARKLEAGR